MIVLIDILSFNLNIIKYDILRVITLGTET